MHSIRSKDSSKPNPGSLTSQIEALPFMSAKDHYHIGGLQHSQYDILAWVYENNDNPGVKVR